MNSKELLDAGELPAAISQVSAELRADPANKTNRTFLFELLCCIGDLDRAAKQLDAIAAGQGADQDVMAQRYRRILEGEKARRRTFSDGLVPGLPETVPSYVRLHLEAINRIREDRFEVARELLEESEARRPPLSGQINGESFDDLKDVDDLIGPFLEMISEDGYAWVPWGSVRSVSMDAPRFLRDLIWLPARVDLDSGHLGEVYLPVLYARSYQHPDNRIKLGRMTEWQGDAVGLSLGSGQRLLSAGECDWPLLEIRELTFEPHGEKDGGSGINS